MTQAYSQRQIVLCCDGTNNNLTGGDSDTNVVKVASLLSNFSSSAEQILFYDPGVGNAGELPGVTFFDKVGRIAERVTAMAFGRGVYENMAQCYLFLMRNYRPGDELYIFGFSRGALTARSIGGLINMFGVLQPHMESMIPTLLHIYFSDREDNVEKMARIAKQTKKLFCLEAARAVDITYMGVWDTVASVGLWPFQAKITAKPTIDGKRYLNVRHALALDEHRAQFQPRLYSDNNGTYSSAEVGKNVTLEQKWFCGSHCDVGGGYVSGQTLISDKAFYWIVSEAVRCGLALKSEGVLLDSEDKVAIALTTLYKPTTEGFIHSELRNSCLWALTGMAVRDTTKAVVDGSNPYPVEPVEHASVSAMAASYPESTVWSKMSRSTGAFFKCVLTAVVLLILMGWMLTGTTYVNSIWDYPSNIGNYLHQNIQFWRWQTLWMFEGNVYRGVTNFAWPRWALIFDFGLIAAYTYVLAWLAVWGFARNAGLRRIKAGVPKWLSILGWALPFMTACAILQNIAAWIAISLLSFDFKGAGYLFAGLMSVLSVCKVVGLVAVLVLIFLPRKSSKS